MEKHSPVIGVQPDPIPSRIDILNDALGKCKGRFDKACQDNNTDRLYDCVSQMTQLSHSINEAIKAEREGKLEKAISELADAIDVMSEDLEDVLDGLLDGTVEGYLGAEDKFN